MFIARGAIKMIIKERNLKKIQIDEYFLDIYFLCQERAYMSCKMASRKLRDNTSYWLKKYKPVLYDHIEYNVLKKIFFKTFSKLKDDKQINLKTFKSICLVILEKEKIKNNLNESIVKKILKDISKYFYLINEFDISDSANSFGNLNIDLKNYFLERKNSLDKKYFHFFENINLDELDAFIKINFISIQVKDNFFNLIITLPGNEYSYESFINLLIRFAFNTLSKELNAEFNSLIVYFLLSKERKIYTVSNVYKNAEDFTIIKILKTFVNKFTIKHRDKAICIKCENKKMCDRG